jgi:hypothetical protein
MMTILSVLFLAFVIWFDFVPIVKSKSIMGCVAFGILFVTCVTIMLLMQFGVQVPSAIFELENFLKEIGLTY